MYSHWLIMSWQNTSARADIKGKAASIPKVSDREQHPSNLIVVEETVGTQTDVAMKFQSSVEVKDSSLRFLPFHQCAWKADELLTMAALSASSLHHGEASASC